MLPANVNMRMGTVVEGESLPLVHYELFVAFNAGKIITGSTVTLIMHSANVQLKSSLSLKNSEIVPLMHIHLSHFQVCCTFYVKLLANQQGAAGQIW